MSYLCNASAANLVIIDLQEKLMPVIFDNAQVLRRASVLAQAARLLAIPVIGTVQQPLRLGRTMPLIDDMLDQTIEKCSFDARAEPAFLAALDNGRDELVILGCEAHVCVLQTVLGLLHRQRRVKLVIDAIGSRQERDKICAIDRARAAGADIVSSEMVMFEWMRNSEHPKFREILKLIK
ncbi:isochorismatase family protein [Collimonas arenae]|uniref:Isochorismatase family protein n=2 Tax=Collimonas arenae TaxID=279058 RepID=A0A127QDP1_9BURK|nr:isochorismatase family protein [Collimonas arenae]AMO98088.1 isochorismatase family protein [Collimonas arenae]AMP07955.1 isochorismatase family protein [Collimonas arenae]